MKNAILKFSLTALATLTLAACGMWKQWRW